MDKIQEDRFAQQPRQSQRVDSWNFLHTTLRNPAARALSYALDLSLSLQQEDVPTMPWLSAIYFKTISFYSYTHL